jgi:DNA-binding transcriptional MocR family regulator
MTSTKIDWSFNKISKFQDLSDLADLLFPSNRNQQHAFMVIWLAIKWSPHRLVPNVQAVATQHGISRRTMERVRAKMRRMGLIDHVSRFNKAYGYREGWIWSGRFERSLRELADRMAALKDQRRNSRDKDEMLIGFCRARKAARSSRAVEKSRDVMNDE